MRAALVLFVAQGFGAGRVPAAPGTWGTILGMGWAAWVLRQGGTPWAWGITAASILMAVPLCTAAERILKKRDPGSVVLDEIVVVPLVGLPLVTWVPAVLPWSSWTLPLVGFVAFRLFDIWKPGPIRASQSLPAGWGVVMDDVLAALLAGAVVLGLARLGVGVPVR